MSKTIKADEYVKWDKYMGDDMEDLISRQALLRDIEKYHLSDGMFQHWVEIQQPVEPTLYGYKIEHLAYIARVMQKEGITAEDAARTFDDLGRVVSWTIDEVRQKMKEVIYDHNTGKI